MALGPVCSNAISLRFFHVLSVIKASFPKCSMKKPNVIKQKQKRNTHLYKYIYYIYIYGNLQPTQFSPLQNCTEFGSAYQTLGAEVSHRIAGGPAVDHRLHPSHHITHMYPEVNENPRRFSGETHGKPCVVKSGVKFSWKKIRVVLETGSLCSWFIKCMK